MTENARLWRPDWALPQHDHGCRRFFCLPSATEMVAQVAALILVRMNMPTGPLATDSNPLPFTDRVTLRLQYSRSMRSTEGKCSDLIRGWTFTSRQ